MVRIFLTRKKKSVCEKMKSFLHHCPKWGDFLAQGLTPGIFWHPKANLRATSTYLAATVPQETFMSPPRVLLLSPSPPLLCHLPLSTPVLGMAVGQKDNNLASGHT